MGITTWLYSTITILLCLLSSLPTGSVTASSPSRRDILRDRTKDLFFHAFDNYMTHAFPADELRPISCKPMERDPPDTLASSVNDICGGFAMTLIDALDALAMLGEHARFREAVGDVVAYLGRDKFDLDVVVQVFEVNIRVLGGLIAAHEIASTRDEYRGWYAGELLPLAEDLGDRLLAAFDTASAIPRPRTNLRHGPAGLGVHADHNETCAAGAGTLVLEFAMLSRLTGDPKYRVHAEAAFRAVWDRRMELGLVGNTLDSETGAWTTYYTGIGAGVDSFYEYALKAHVMLRDPFYLDVWEAAHEAIRQSVYSERMSAPRVVHLRNGMALTNYADALSAFYAGLLVLSGDVEEARALHMFYYALWQRFHAIPERFDLVSRQADLAWWPLRPEFIESTYLLYRATRDPFFLAVGEQVLDDLESRTKTSCGFASLANVVTGTQEDRMESFVLSETLKYLYLLFDDDNPNNDDRTTVLSTEGHPFSVDSSPGVSAAGGNFTSGAVCEVQPVRGLYSAAMSSPRYFAAFHAVNHMPLETDEYLQAHGVYPHPHAQSHALATTPDMDIFFGTMASVLLDVASAVIQQGTSLIISKLRGLRIRFERTANHTLRASRLGLTRKILQEETVTIADPEFETFLTPPPMPNTPPTSTDTDSPNQTVPAASLQFPSIVRVGDGVALFSVGDSSLPTTGESVVATLANAPQSLLRTRIHVPPTEPLTIKSFIYTADRFGCMTPASAKAGRHSDAVAAVVLRGGGCSFLDKVVAMSAVAHIKLVIVIDPASNHQSVQPTLIDTDLPPTTSHTGLPQTQEFEFGGGETDLPPLVMVQNPEAFTVLREPGKVVLVTGNKGSEVGEEERVKGKEVKRLTLRGTTVDNVFLDI
ncbi:hypothetical protein PYCC9005_002507 [Savitreella phatthalungensis]